MLVIICTKYGKNPSRTVDPNRADTIFKVKVKWPWRYSSRSKVITCDTPSHASDHLYQIWKESIKNCRCYRADTIFKVKAKWPWRYRSRSKVIICNAFSHTSDHLYQIWKESIENCRFFFKVKAEKFQKFAKNWNFQILKKRNTPSNVVAISSKLWYKAHFCGQLHCSSLRCSWSIACQHCSNYIFILNLTHGFNRLGKDNCKTRQETFKIWDLLCLILKIWW